MAKIRIIGIDPGTNLTGFGVIDFEKGKYEYVDAGVIRTKPKTPLPKRLVEIYDNLQQLLKEFKPDEVAIEKLYFSKNVTTAMSVSQARGVVMLAAQQHKLRIFEYTPLQVKQVLTGYGRADKKQIQSMVKTALGLKSTPKPDDAADGLALAICHSASQ